MSCYVASLDLQMALYGNILIKVYRGFAVLVLLNYMCKSDYWSFPTRSNDWEFQVSNNMRSSDSGWGTHDMVIPRQYYFASKESTQRDLSYELYIKYLDNIILHQRRAHRERSIL